MLRMPSLLESRSDPLHLWTSLGWKRIQPTFSQMATGCSLNPALRHQDGATLWCSARQNWGTKRAFRGPQRAEEMHQKEFWVEFTIVSKEIQYIVIRRNKIGWTEEKCIEMDKLAQEDHSTAHPLREYERKKEKLKDLTEHIRQKCTDETPIRLPTQQSQLWTVSTENLEKNDLNQSFSSIPKVAFVFFFQLFMVAVESRLVELTIDVFCCGKIVYSWWQSAATDVECEQNTLTHHIFLVFACTSNDVSHDIGSRCSGASYHPCVMRLCVWSLFESGVTSTKVR